MNTAEKIARLVEELDQKFAATDGETNRATLLGSQALGGLLIVAADLDVLGARLDQLCERLEGQGTSEVEAPVDLSTDLAELRRQVAKITKTLKSEKKKPKAK